jgi:hypothetical protein
MNAGDTKRIAVYHLPRGLSVPVLQECVIDAGDSDCVFEYPELSGGFIKDVAERLKQNREAYLSTLTTTEIVDKIDSAVRKWLDPSYPFRITAELLLPVITGYDPEVVRLHLKRYMRTFRRKELFRFLDEELDPAAMLDEFRPRKSGGMSKAYGPELIFHVFSGNVPGVQLWSLIMGLLVKSASLGKTSLDEPLLPALFAASLAEADPRLADCIAVLPWKGGTASLESSAIQAAEAVIVYGSDRAVEAIRARTPPSVKILQYGHKVSFAMIGREALTPDRYVESVRLLAEDTAIYDQQSCMSPQMVFVEQGGSVSPRQFAQLLAAEMARYRKWRRAPISDEEAIAIRSLRSRYEMESLTRGKKMVFASSPDTAWTVIAHEHAGFEGSPLNRTVHVYPVGDLHEVVEHISPYRSYLQSCGLAAEARRLPVLADALGRAGVNRISAVGRMHLAPAGWHHDGRFNLLDLLRFTDIEATAEWSADRYDPDFE